jgi:hypothetical protein
VDSDDSLSDGGGKDYSFDTDDDSNGPVLLRQDPISSTGMSSAFRVGSSPVASVGGLDSSIEGSLGPFGIDSLDFDRLSAENKTVLKKLESFLSEVNGENLEKRLE